MTDLVYIYSEMSIEADNSCRTDLVATTRSGDGGLFIAAHTTSRTPPLSEFQPVLVQMSNLLNALKTDPITAARGIIFTSSNNLNSLGGLSSIFRSIVGHSLSMPNGRSGCFFNAHVWAEARTRLDLLTAASMVSGLTDEVRPFIHSAYCCMHMHETGAAVARSGPRPAPMPSN